jgi:hypothetical protein
MKLRLPYQRHAKCFLDHESPAPSRQSCNCSGVASSRSRAVLLAVFCFLLSESVFAVSITGNGTASVGQPSIPNGGSEVQKTFTGNVLADQGAVTFTDHPIFPFNPTSPYYVVSDAAFFLRADFGKLGEKMSATIKPHLLDTQSASEDASASAMLTAEDTYEVLPDATHVLGSLKTVHVSEALTGSASGRWSAILQTQLIRPNSELTVNMTVSASYLSQANPVVSQSGDFQIVVGEVNTLRFFLRSDASLVEEISGTLPDTSSLDAFNSGHLTIDALGATVVTGSGHDYSVAALPEPETYALMLTGLAALGLGAARRKLNR